jgi:hypothetical protein
MAGAVQGFFFKAGSLKNQSWITIADVAEVTVRGQIAQTVGMRILFFFPVSVCPFPIHGAAPFCASPRLDSVAVVLSWWRSHQSNVSRMFLSAHHSALINFKVVQVPCQYSRGYGPITPVRVIISARD